MQLDDKVAVVYGGGGAMGGAAARAFARAGAHVFIGGRTIATLDAVAADISAAGGTASTAVVDVDDRDAVEEHLDSVVASAGRVDICFNAAGMDAVQNVPLVDMSVDDYLVPIVESARRQFNTATGAAQSSTD